MFISDKWKDFELIDCSKGEKLERWGEYILVRPDPQAIWETPRRDERWKLRDGRYQRSESGGGSWDKSALPESWQIRYGELRFNVRPMNFKHTGIFPEQACNWDWAMEKIRSAQRPISVLNLFGYTGAATLACAKAGASVCHVDAAKGMVAWGKENAALSGLGDAPIRWIVDDCGARPGRRGLEARKGPVGLCVPLRRGAVGRAAVRPYQFLHHRPVPLGAELRHREHLHKEIRRPLRQPRARPSGHGQRARAALRGDGPLGEVKKRLS